MRQMEHIDVEQMCHETISQGCQTDRYTLKPSSLASVNVKHRKIAVGQEVEVRSRDIFDVKSEAGTSTAWGYSCSRVP